MQVVPVPCLVDNYAYLIFADGSSDAAVVDPSEAAPVTAALAERGLKLGAIFNTHHHWDHVGGNEELVAQSPGIGVYGHDSDRGRIPGQTRFLADGEEFDELGLHFAIRHIPGHTTGAIAYIVEDAVFTGDTLFAAGCGRLFEGTPAMMYTSLNETLRDLPDATRVFFGHEYTEANLRFAEAVDPQNPEITARVARVKQVRESGHPTTPSTMTQERATNPFMRCSSDGIRAELSVELGARANDPVEVFTALRTAKDGF
jgi:hydroxyacylglutathione hydrolase